MLTSYVSYSYGAETQRDWATAEQLASEGWELVGVAPDEQALMMLDGGASVTRGLHLLFKRPVD